MEKTWELVISACRLHPNGIFYSMYVSNASITTHGRESELHFMLLYVEHFRHYIYLLLHLCVHVWECAEHCLCGEKCKPTSAFDKCRFFNSHDDSDSLYEYLWTFSSSHSRSVVEYWFWIKYKWKQQQQPSKLRPQALTSV